jgi:hypothetical protein
VSMVLGFDVGLERVYPLSKLKLVREVYGKVCFKKSFSLLVG